MISETTFSKKFTSFWAQLLPSANYYVRVVNEGMLESFYAPIKPVRPDNVALCNVVSFEVFKEILEGSVLKNEIENHSYFASESFSRILDREQSYVRRFQHGAPTALSPTNEELLDIGRLSLETIERFGFQKHKIAVHPGFEGIGFLNPAEGDILEGSKLVEIKAGYRKFSVYDLRQVLVYLTMNFFSSAPHEIESIELYNPRMGISFSVGVRELCESVSALLPQDLFTEIQLYVTENNFVELH